MIDQEEIHNQCLSEYHEDRYYALYQLGHFLKRAPLFSVLPNKQQAWEDLHKLVSDEDYWVRHHVAIAIGFAFAEIPNKQQAWNDLIKLSIDDDIYVRSYASHFFVRISILKACQSEKEYDYKKELENAIEFFEIAEQESPNWLENPAKFCLPFYRLFYMMLFEKQGTTVKIDEYLIQAKDAVRNSEVKEYSFEIIKLLSDMLKEVHTTRNVDIEAKKRA